MSPGLPTIAWLTPGVAGRGHELAVVRRHLESGSGLLLIAGECGSCSRSRRPFQ